MRRPRAASDTRARREVVAQTRSTTPLYAASGSVFWAPAWLRDWFEEGGPARGLDRQMAVLHPADHEPEDRAEARWQQIGINLRDGHILLVFVADEIPASLPRLVEFLNGQMPRVGS